MSCFQDTVHGRLNILPEITQGYNANQGKNRMKLWKNFVEAWYVYMRFQIPNDVLFSFAPNYHLQVNVIVATSILEEGLDVQSCNLVIMFDPSRTVCSFIQSRGRARMQNSDYLLMVKR